MTRIPLTDTAFIFGLRTFLKSYREGSHESREHSTKIARSDKQWAMMKIKGQK